MIGLYADSIRKQFGIKQVLNDIFITCQQEQIVGLLGRNGSGKSSLLKIIFGSISADQKFVTVDSRKINNLFDSRDLINYLPQNNYLPSHIKIKNLISCFCNKSNVDLLMKDDFISPLLNHKTKQLSGGERRFVEILLMVYSDTKYLLLDEPFNGIAPLYIDVIKNHIKEQSKNKGFIITDHAYENVLDISSSVFLMSNGNIRKIKEFADLIEFGYLTSTSKIPNWYK
ncbi:MAG: ATP-binding cassette domain-containing protein [Janthinobacterium lividum]